MLITKKSLIFLSAISFCDQSAVTKIFIVSCVTDSYKLCFCGTVSQTVVHSDLSGSKCGTKTAFFYRSWILKVFWLNTYTRGQIKHLLALIKFIKPDRRSLWLTETFLARIRDSIREDCILNDAFCFGSFAMHRKQFNRKKCVNLQIFRLVLGI